MVMPPLRDMTPDRARACRPSRRPSPGPPMPPILQTSGTITPRQLGPMIRAWRIVGQLDHLGDVAGGGSAR